MGFGFWAKVFAIAVAAAVGAVLALVLIGSAFVRWGLFGGLLAIAVVLILIGWITDRRRARDDYVAPPPGEGGSSATPRRGPFPPSGA